MWLIKEYGQEEYDFSSGKRRPEIIEDVARLRSGIDSVLMIYQTVINKILKSYDLEFHLLFIAKPHVLSAEVILLQKKVITIRTGNISILVL